MNHGLEMMDQGDDFRQLMQARHAGRGAATHARQGDNAAGGARALQPPIGDQLVRCLNSPRTKVGVSCTCCCLVVSIILVGISIGSLGPLQYGLRYNTFSKQIDASAGVYQGGRHLIGPFNSFIVFPATVLNIEFSTAKNASAAPLQSRTQDGLALTLHISLQYHLVPEEIPDLYHQTNINYPALYIKLVREALLYSSSQYTGAQFYQQRPFIGRTMFDVVNAQLNISHAVCTGLQVLQIDLPSTYDQSIVNTQVRKQTVKTKQNQQKAKYVRAQIGAMIADYQKNVTITLNTAHANATLTTKTAAAKAAQMKIDVEQKALKMVNDVLGLKNADYVKYQRNTIIQGLPNSNFLFGVENPVAVLSQGTHASQMTSDHSGDWTEPFHREEL